MKDRDGMGQALHALEAGEVVEATAWFDRLTASSRKQGSRGIETSTAAWDSLTRLLEKRGYFAATPEQVSKSLEEIRDVGVGFDLYDLVVAMARYYGTVAAGAGPFEPLKPFAARSKR